METAGISYRVADFLKQHAPFHAVDDADLVALAAHGRVKFHEPNEFILWQGEPHRLYIFVIQQGTVSLWDEAGGHSELRDIRGPGDMLGIERYNAARSCLYSARSESDVVIYAFPATDFEALVLKHAVAATYVAAGGHVTADYQGAGGRREPQRVFLHDLVGRKMPATCGVGDSIAEAARRLLASRSRAIGVVDAERRVRSVLTADTVLEWVAAGGGDARQPLESVHQEAATAVGPNASVADGVLAMATANADALVVTDDGTPNGRLQAVVAPRDLAPLFGEQPASLLREIRLAASGAELGELNQRARAFTLAGLTSAASVEWLARFTHLVDVAILTRIVAMSGVGPAPGCWCFGASSGRGESLTRLAPYLLVILDGGDEVSVRDRYRRVLDQLQACDYLPRLELPFDLDFYVASAGEWKARFRNWVSDPIRQQTYRVRSLFDLRPVCGQRSLWQDVEAATMEAVDAEFLHVLANDCLACLPPLTFFQDAVVDSVGEQRATFELDRTALKPLVDVGRVFGMAARKVMGRSTLERFVTARTLVPEHEAIFREAADTLRIVLWQQGRVGITQGTGGSDIPPALLSRHDRQVLKGGFRSILRLLEFTADRGWLANL